MNVNLLMLPLLPKKWLMKSLVWQRHRHQKVFYRLGGLYICAVRLDILKCEQTSLFYSASYLNSGGSFVSEGLSPSKTLHGNGTV